MHMHNACIIMCYVYVHVHVDNVHVDNVYMYVVLHATDTCRSHCINALWFVVISQEREEERERERERERELV